MKRNFIVLKNNLFFIFLIFLLFIFVDIQPVSFAFGSENLQSLFQQALQETKHGDFQLALEDWNKYLEIFQNDSAALSNRGNVRLILGDPEGAISDQTRSIEISPTEVDPHLNRGIAEENLNRFDAARSDYEWILLRDPENSSALYNLGNIMGAQGNWDLAESLFRKASFSQSEFPMARSSRALALYQLGEFGQAESELRNLIRRYPMMADARAGLTALLWRKGSFGEAESHWAAVAGLDMRYGERVWLSNSRRWPSIPVDDLMAFLSLGNKESN